MCSEAANVFMNSSHFFKICIHPYTEFQRQLHRAHLQTQENQDQGATGTGFSFRRKGKLCAIVINVLNSLKLDVV